MAYQAMAEGSHGIATWKVVREMDPIYDMPNIEAILLERKAESFLDAMGGRKFLSLRCREGRLEAYVRWGSLAALGFSFRDETQDVIVRYDKNPPRTETWSRSTNRRATFAPDPYTFLNLLGQHELLAMRIYPKSGGSVTAVFDLGNAMPVIEEVLSACPLRPSQPADVFMGANVSVDQIGQIEFEEPRETGNELVRDSIETDSQSSGVSIEPELPVDREANVAVSPLRFAPSDVVPRAEIEVVPPSPAPDEGERDVRDGALFAAAAPSPVEAKRLVVDAARFVVQQDSENADAAVGTLPPSGLEPEEGFWGQGSDFGLPPLSVAPSDVVPREKVEVEPPPPAPEQAEPAVIEVAALPPPPRNLTESGNEDDTDVSESNIVRASPPAPRPSGQPQSTESVTGPTALLDSLGEALESLPQDGGGRAGLPFAALRQQLSGSERGYLVSKISGCWRPLPILGQAGAPDLVVTIGVELTLDGNVAAEPILVAPKPLPSGNEAYRVAFDLARSAVKGCAPYDQLPREKHQRWRKFEISFDPEGMVSR